MREGHPIYINLPRCRCRDVAEAGEGKVGSDEEEGGAYFAFVRHKQNQLFVDRLDRSQDAWETYRQAIYPRESHDATNWVSIYPMCASTVMEGKARQRIAELRQWLEKSPDVCGGTRPSSL